MRGGSFGSYITSYLLAQKGAGEFSDLGIAGVHLSGGFNYPNADLLPADIPLLISHGMNDGIASVDHAANFYHELMRARTENTYSFFTTYGDHHNIDPTTTSDEPSSPQYQELFAYAKALHSIILGQACDPGARPPIYLKKNENKDPHVLGPTMAHLKLVLGRDFSGNINNNLRLFYDKHFDPIFYQPKSSAVFDFDKNSTGIPETIWSRFVQMIKKEQRAFEANDKQVVYYHTASNTTMQFYMFLTLWHNEINNLADEDLTLMRSFLVGNHHFPTINNFLIHMRKTHELYDKKNVFNYIPALPTLLSLLILG